MNLLKILLIIFFFALFASCKFRLDFPKFPEIETMQVEVISIDSIKCGGTIYNDGGAKIEYYGVCWDTLPNPTISLTTKTKDGYNENVYTSILPNLKMNVDYYIRAYAVNEVGTSYGRQVVFTNHGATPTVFTTDITNNNGISFSCGGNITNDGEWSIISSGICWAYGHNPTLGDADGITKDGVSAGEFISTITGINVNKGVNIYVCAYATNKVGTSYGEVKVLYPGSPYYIGQTFGGGIIYYINNSGNHGLIAAPNDQNTNPVKWGCSGTNIGDASGIAIGAGEGNTNAIVLGCSESGIAALVCSNLTLGGFSDWYLPSQLELNTMYYSLKLNNLSNFQITGTEKLYWSSTQADANSAYVDNFYNGQISKLGKNSITGYIRAIRSF